MIHYTDNYLLNPTHKVTVNLVGCGGTGSQVLNLLAKMNVGLQALGHPGLFVTVYDDDIVSDANRGRQLFSEADIGVSKAVVSVSRINRFFGTDWSAVPEKYDQIGAGTSPRANLLITCVDTAKTRVEIAKNFTKDVDKRKGREPNLWEFYWMDFGNLKETGQVVLGSAGHVMQPNQPAVIHKLKNVVQYFPQLKKIREKNQGPSCSLAEALNKQDLFINSTLANHGMSLLWTMFTKGRILNQGVYLNLSSSQVNPLPFK